VRKTNRRVVQKPVGKPKPVGTPKVSGNKESVAPMPTKGNVGTTGFKRGFGGIDSNMLAPARKTVVDNKAKAEAGKALLRAKGVAPPPRMNVGRSAAKKVVAPQKPAAMPARPQKPFSNRTNVGTRFTTNPEGALGEAPSDMGGGPGGVGFKKGGSVAKPGLYANIHAKKKRIAAGSGEKMRKVGSKGAPSKMDFIKSAKTAKRGR
jgi:hypothetical protein